MSTRAQVCAWIAAAGLFAPSAADAQDRTEREVIDLIVREGPRAQAIRAEADAAGREQQARLAWPNPTVSYAREGAGFTEFVQAEQVLPIFGTRAALVRAGAAATAAAEAERDARLWRLRAEAAEALARLGSAQARVEAADTHAREVARLIDVLATREREGEGSRFDRLRAEQELREARLLATTAAIDLAGARSAVEALLPPDVGLGRVAAAAPPAQAPGPLDALVARAMSARGERRALQRAGERADLEAAAARRARTPVPTVIGGVKRADDASGREVGGVIGLSLSLPIFDAGQREAARWQVERQRADAERAAIERRIHAEVTRAYEALRLREVALAEDPAGAADALIAIAEVGYREGELGILELLDGVRTAARARLRTIDASGDVRLARIALEHAVGEVLWP